MNILIFIIACISGLAFGRESGKYEVTKKITPRLILSGLVFIALIFYNVIKLFLLFK